MRAAAKPPSDAPVRDGRPSRSSSQQPSANERQQAPISDVKAKGEPDKARLGRAPRIDANKAPIGRRVWDWLMEDTAKGSQAGTSKERTKASGILTARPAPSTERQKALAQVAADDKAARKHFVRSVLAERLAAAKTKLGIGRSSAAAASGSSSVPHAAATTRAPTPADRAPAGADGAAKQDKPSPAMPTGLAAGAAAGRAKTEAARESPEASTSVDAAGAPATADGTQASSKGQPGPVSRWVSGMLGAKRVADSRGKLAYAPTGAEDWRWKLHKLLHSRTRVLSIARSAILTMTIVVMVWGLVFATTGFDLAANLQPINTNDDIADDMEAFKLPFFIIESGSMMHKNAPYGRIGTIDPGDITIIQKIDPSKHREQIRTFYGDSPGQSAGGRGDVILYLPLATGDFDPQPIIHRAMTYVEVAQKVIPNPEYRENGIVARTLTVVRYNVEEFGIVNADSITIPELGLWNYQPRNSGYITRGDNVRTNVWSDQALGLAPQPISPDRIIGRLAGEVPFIGLTKLALQGQNPALISPDESWCTFLLGSAPCDTWQVFLVIASAAFGGPVLWAFIVYGRRSYLRRLDALALRRMQAQMAADEAAARAAAEAALRAQEDRPVLPIHSAEDLLAGRVRLRDGSGPAFGSRGSAPRETLPREHRYWE